MGRFSSVSGPRGSVRRHTEAFDTASPRQIHPRSPEASTIFILPVFFHLFLKNLGRCPWTMGPMGQGPWTMGPWARVHGPKTGKRLSDVAVHVEAIIVC